MSTSVSERVRQFRERQRRANPKEPFWPDLTGKLNTAAIWLDLGNPAPDSFVDAIKTVAIRLGFQLCEPLPCRGYGPEPGVDDR